MRPWTRKTDWLPPSWKLVGTYVCTASSKSKPDSNRHGAYQSGRRWTGTSSFGWLATCRGFGIPRYADPAIKQRIVRILIQEVVADVDQQAEEIVLVIHWVGGRHSELRVPRLKTGHHSRCTKAEAVDIVRQMASEYSDEEIALTLNRLGLKTGVGNTWNEMRVRSLRSYLKLPGFKAGHNDSRLNLQEAAERLGVSPTVVRRLIERKIFSRQPDSSRRTMGDRGRTCRIIASIQGSHCAKES